MDPELTSLSDADLLAQIALRNRDAFKLFYDRTSPRIYPLGIKMLGTRTAADDLVQDVYLKVWYNAEAYRPERGDPVAWLVAMTRYRAIDVLRSSSEHKFSDEEVPDTPVDPLSWAPQARIADCMDALEQMQRQNIFMAFFKGFTHSEIAAVTDEPVGTIKSRIRRGLLALKECLEQ